ncbi:amidohydrolase family protein [Amnibacterium kyonggiense]|uniref:Cytosine/adenosine deaminase-related metal-dependent hydrolase n=1 Tax=Amnibacterium kyonggiense TaxID=595671 RepID=A0A4R7FL60_9MICO|nr:amidohydrolase family protein [Amnibacterium kyonggiense]TDS77098.1 cytosine/adenosine deaminase-related metal-dependent hydrolase [Amnibacterium kyonggiense]
MTLLVVGARLITMAGDGSGYREHGWMRVDEGRITALGAGEPPEVAGAEMLDVRGAFVAPGFVSAHSHLFTSGARGLGVESTLYGWCDSMLGLMSHASPEDYYWSSLHGSLDFIANGTTTAFDFTDPRIPWEPMVDGAKSGAGRLRPLEQQTRQIDAKRDSGLRFINAASLDDAIGSDEEVLDRFGLMVDHVRGMDPDFALGAAIMGAVQWSPRPNAAELEVAAMRRYGVINEAHFLETREAVELQRSKFALYRDAGALELGLIFGHFIQTTPEIIAEAAARGGRMSWQPASNGRLASGTADIVRIREAGMPIGVGLDDQACTDVSDPWQNMRIGMYAVRAASGDPLAVLPEDVLRMATLGSAEVLGVADRVGSLEVGKFADFVVVDPRKPDMGPLWHPVRNYVLSTTLRNLSRVYIGGELVAEDGVSTNPLAERAVDEVHRRMPAVAAAWGHPA